MERKERRKKENDIIDKSLSIHASFRLVLGQKRAKETVAACLNPLKNFTNNNKYIVLLLPKGLMSQVIKKVIDMALKG